MAYLFKVGNSVSTKGIHSTLKGRTHPSVATALQGCPRSRDGVVNGVRGVSPTVKRRELDRGIHERDATVRDLQYGLQFLS